MNASECSKLKVLISYVVVLNINIDVNANNIGKQIMQSVIKFGVQYAVNDIPDTIVYRSIVELFHSLNHSL